MTTENIEFGVKFITDPSGEYTKRFGSSARERCIQGCGMLPNMMVGIKDTIAENMVDNYSFFAGWTGDKQGSFNPETHAFEYPGDPAQYPLVSAQLVDEEGTPYGELVYVYPYAIVCVVQDGKLVKRTRMD